jgi:hypothetical protein
MKLITHLNLAPKYRIDGTPPLHLKFEWQNKFTQNKKYNRQPVYPHNLSILPCSFVSSSLHGLGQSSFATSECVSFYWSSMISSWPLLKSLKIRTFYVLCSIQCFRKFSATEDIYSTFLKCSFYIPPRRLHFRLIHSSLICLMCVLPFRAHCRC